MKENIARLGHGGANAVTGGDRPGSLSAVMKEIQGWQMSLLTGAGANTKVNLAAIRQEDTIVGALNNNAGTITDITGTMSIDDLRATGTVTAAAVVAADTVTLDGKVYTAVANGVDPGLDYTKFSVGASNTECAANLAAAINRRMANTAVPNVFAEAASAVVTIKAVEEGTDGNSIALASSNGGRLAVSGANLAGGSATGGVRSTGATNQIILFWYDKK